MSKLLQMGSFKRYVCESARKCVPLHASTSVCMNVSLHMCKCMCIISDRPRNDSMSPLVLTALKLANRAELFAAELRPLA